jgi:hypothetical protein
MKHDFSAQFLRITHPDTNFGDAWESLCFELLREELQDNSLMRLNPPDCGIDILYRKLNRAYQCKSHEQGASGTINADDSVNSLTTAYKDRATFGWQTYYFAINGKYSGTGFKKIMAAAAKLGLTQQQVEFLGPEYWDELCAKHFEKVRDRFDYRIGATEKQVIDALRSARYFERYISEYSEKISRANFSLVITNNRTPLEIEIPFSPELSVENYLDVAKGLLGISLDWTNFNDLNTSAGLSLSVTIDRKAQPFSAKIGDLPIEPGQKLELWIKVKWREEKQKDGVSSDTMYYQLREYVSLELLHPALQLNPQKKRELTVEREEALIQAMIWKAAHDIRSGNARG